MGGNNVKDIDPVEELHKIRWEICKKAGGTPADYFRYYLEMDKKIAADKAAEAANLREPKAVKSKPRRKPAAKVSTRKPAQRRKAATP